MNIILAGLENSKNMSLIFYKVNRAQKVWISFFPGLQNLKNNEFNFFCKFKKFKKHGSRLWKLDKEAQEHVFNVLQSSKGLSSKHMHLLSFSQT